MSRTFLVEWMVLVPLGSTIEKKCDETNDLFCVWERHLHAEVRIRHALNYGKVKDILFTKGLMLGFMTSPYPQLVLLSIPPTTCAFSAVASFVDASRVMIFGTTTTTTSLLGTLFVFDLHNPLGDDDSVVSSLGSTALETIQ